MISSSTIPPLVQPHRGQGRVRCRGRGSTPLEHDGLVPHVIDFPLDDIIANRGY